MPQVLAYTDQFKPDFGIPYDRDFDTKLQALSDKELFALLEFKTWLDRTPNIQPADLQAAMGKIPEHIRPMSIRYLAEKNAQIDPVQWGYTLDSWREVNEDFQKYRTHCIFGGNRGGKSSYAATLCMHLALVIPEFQARCYHVNEEKSVAEQQAFIYEALPQRFKQMGKKRGQHFTVQYTQQNGFTNGKLIIPPLPGYKRGGEIIFQNYEQYKNNAQIVEGFWAHFIWTDEEVPIKMYERLLTRLGDANGRLLMTFTTIQGWSALVAEILGKTKTLRKRRAPLLGNKEIPVAQESISRRNTRIHYFWTEDNPFIPPAWIGELLQGRPESEIKAVAYGIPTKSATTPFPHFSEEIHVIPASQMPWLNRPEDEDEPPEFTRYHVTDPAGSKPWFMIWAAVDAKETIYVYAESPESTTWGPWAEPGSTMEGKAGPAQKPNGYGIPDYIDIMHSEEATPEGSEVEMKVFERVIDSRLGAATTQTAEGATSIISELEKADITVVPAPGLNIEHGLQLINTYLKPEGFDPSKPVGPLNHPKLFISDRCQSLIFCMKEYTAKGGKDEATKDPVDCIRMLLENGANFIPKAAQKGKASTFSY